MTDQRSRSSSAPWHALVHRDYRLLAGTQFVSLIGSQMQVAALHWHIYLLTGSAVALGSLGLTRVVPLIFFSLWGGIVADRHDRKRIMFLSQSVMALAAAALGWATFSGKEPLWMLYLVSAIGAAAAAFDNPARQALVPRLVPTAQLPGALALNLTAFNAATIIGPAISGLIMSGTGRDQSAGREVLALIYLVNAASFLVVLTALAFIKTAGTVVPASGKHAAFFESLKEGLRFVWSTPVMVWTLALDFFATFFAGSLSLLPIVADVILGRGASGYGMLLAAPAVGAVCGSIFTALRPLPRRQGVVLLAAVLIYGLATILVGLSPWFWLTFLALVISGLADAISTVIRQTLRQLLTPDRMRGRMTSINMIFFMGGPQLGELEAGLIAGLFSSVALGATVSIVSGGVATVLVAVLIGRLTPVVRRYEMPRGQ